MAVDLGKLVAEAKETIELGDISGKTLAIDAYNTIYQFLSIIRQPDGSPLVDSKGRVTSHLSGIIYRTASLLEYGITPIYVFDGMPPLLKRRTLEARANRRAQATEEWRRAKEMGQMEEARRHAMASTRINAEIIASSKELLGYLGIPFLQAPGEGEAQAAAMAKEGLVYASASQDYDSFLFGAGIVIRNLTISGRRKLPMKNVYVEVKPERIELDRLLGRLGIGQRQLIMLGILVGTDFNMGVDRVGPKTALKIVKEHDTPEKMERYVTEKYGMNFDPGINEVLDVFENPDVEHMTEDKFSKRVRARNVDVDGVMKFMCDEHGFSEDRIAKAVEKFGVFGNSKKQQGINRWM